MQDAFAHCEALVRAADKDRFLATLFAPAEHRGALFALYAFNVEIARVREVVREPLAGRNPAAMVERRARRERPRRGRGHPVAAALLATLRALPAAAGAARGAGRGAPVRSLRRADGDARGARRLCAGRSVQPDRAGRANSRAGGEPEYRRARPPRRSRPCALPGLLKAFPVHAARGQLYVPLDILQRHGADRDDVPSGQATPQLRAALAELRVVARRHLAQARELIADCRRPRSCPRCCRSRQRRRPSRAWSGATMIRSCRSRSRPGGGNG